NGQQVFRGVLPAKGRQRVDLSKIPSGIYMIHIKNGSQLMKQQKLVIYR
ncbi:MAG: T9SS type A sorting domain-containing protein, partial [Owenweeksia sp.]